MLKRDKFLEMMLDNLFKNLIYDPVSVLGLLVFYLLLVNLPISLVSVFKKKVIYIFNKLRTCILLSILLLLNFIKGSSKEVKKLNLSFNDSITLFLILDA